MSKSTIAYIVVCWNNKDIISQCLDSIFAQDYPDKAVYVIDNNSSDGSADYIAEQFPNVHLTRSGENTGFARGNNILIKQAILDEKVGYFALINSDATLDSKWSSELVACVSKKHKVACAQGITLDYFDHSIVDAEHVYVGDNFQSVQYGYGESVRHGFMYPRKVFGVNAAAAIYNREYLEDQPDTTLFDEKFYMYLEDVDVCFRAVMTGWNNYSVPSATAFHMGSVSMKKRSSDYNIYMTFRNQSALLFKNMPFKTFITFIPTALNFERHFYRHLSKTVSKKTSRRAMRGRLVGLMRLPLYIPDHIRLARKRQIPHTQLERVMRNKGIF